MSEAGDNLESAEHLCKREFKNGDINPEDESLVLWGYKGDDPWWMSWAEYWSMARRHKGVVRQRRRVNGVVKRGLLK